MSNMRAHDEYRRNIVSNSPCRRRTTERFEISGREKRGVRARRLVWRRRSGLSATMSRVTADGKFLVGGEFGGGRIALDQNFFAEARSLGFGGGSLGRVGRQEPLHSSLPRNWDVFDDVAGGEAGEIPVTASRAPWGDGFQFKCGGAPGIGPGMDRIDFSTSVEGISLLGMIFFPEKNLGAKTVG